MFGLIFGLTAISFGISNFEKINDHYAVEASISGAATDSAYFVQTMLTRADQNSYFGFTWSQKGEWLKYLSSPDKELIKSDFPSLKSGEMQKILFKPDTDSSKYQGPGEYVLKMKRYTGESSSGYYADNSLTVNLTEITPTQTPAAPTQTPTPTPVQTSIPTQTPTPSPTRPSPTASPSEVTTPSPTEEIIIIEGIEETTPTGEVLGETTKQDEIPKRSNNVVPLVVTIIVTVVTAFGLIWRFQKRW